MNTVHPYSYVRKAGNESIIRKSTILDVFARAFSQVIAAAPNGHRYGSTIPYQWRGRQGHLSRRVNRSTHLAAGTRKADVTSQFFAIAANLMRHILVDHARRQSLR